MTPRVWALLSYRAGETQQILGLAESLGHRLGWTWETRRLSYRVACGALPNVLRQVTLAGIDRRRSDPLRPPWPDLVISAGLRNEPVARWIRLASGGHTRLVHIGRTWAAREHFDLVVTTPQYQLPGASNVLENPTTLHRVTRQRLDDARAHWASTFACAAQPRIGVLVGGSSGPYALGPRAGSRLGAAARECAGGGCVVATTSARTEADAARAFEARLGARDMLWRWQPGANVNPYFAILAWADALIVTGDSAAMLSEAVATGLPVWIFDLGGMRADGRAPIPRDRSIHTALYARLMRFGPSRLSRDICELHAKLIASGRAAWLGEPAPPAVGNNDATFETTIARIATLLAPS